MFSTFDRLHADGMLRLYESTESRIPQTEAPQPPVQILAGDMSRRLPGLIVSKQPGARNAEGQSAVRLGIRLGA